MTSLSTYLLMATLTAAPAANGGAAAPVEVVKFTATWCGPCRAMEPVLDQVRARGVPVTPIDVDQRPEVARQHAITSVPTMLLVSNGEVRDRIDGVVSTEVLLARIERVRRSSPSGDQRASSQRRSDRARDPRRQPAAETGPPSARPSAARPTSSPRGGGRPTDRDRGRTPRSSEINDAAIAASVRLRVADDGGESFGTGTIVDVHDRDALILTCGHIFRDSDGKGAIRVEFLGPHAGTAVSGQLLRFDLDRDLALVAIRIDLPIRPMRVAPPDARVRVGQSMFSVGCNSGEDPTVMVGELKAINKYQGPNNLVVSGQPVLGRSGGGLFTRDGQLVGVCNAADPEYDEGIYAAFSSIHHHLDAAKLSFVYHSPDSDSPTSNTEMDDSRVRLAGGPMAGLERRRGVRPAAAIRDGMPSHDESGAEVICIIRSKQDPNADSRVMVIDRPSREFLDRLTAEHENQQQRRPTGLRTTSLPPIDARGMPRRAADGRQSGRLPASRSSRDRRRADAGSSPRAD